MKKLILTSIVAAAACIQLQAQTPEKKSIALFYKITATWCGPCGSWGWQLAEEVNTQTAGKALFVGLYASSSSTFYNSTVETLADQFTFGGYPDFGVNGLEKSSANSSPQGINTAGVKSDCIASINSFAATTPTASAASNVSISGNTINVNAKVQFWSAASGEYYLAAYVIEDGAMAVQASRGSAPVAHHGVLRASMTASSAWGEQIATRSIAANQTYTKNFTFNITDAQWDKAKLKVYNVLWKKEGGAYKFVNANVGILSGGTGVETLINTAGVTLFPNPVNNNLHVGIDALKSATASITVSDITGRQISNTTVKLEQGKSQNTINTASLAPGLYFLSIQTESGSFQKRFVKE
jgi:hypothetical protein